MSFRTSCSVTLFSGLLTLLIIPTSLAENYIDMWRTKESTISVDKDSIKKTDQGYSFLMKQTFYPGSSVKYIKGSYAVDCKNRMFETIATYTVYTNGRFYRNTKKTSERPNLNTIGDDFLTEFCE